MNSDLLALTQLVRQALKISDAIGLDDVGIYLNSALVALDGIGDPGRVASVFAGGVDLAEPCACIDACERHSVNAASHTG